MPKSLGTESPLTGITVIEVADEVGARYCGRLFAVQGATVLTAPPQRPTPASSGMAAFDGWLDEDKTIVADLATALRRLDGRPDVVIAGQHPVLIEEVDAVIADTPARPLRLGLTWFGRTGPYADWEGDDALIQALIGIAQGFGAADGPPMMPQGRAPSVIAGATLFMAGLAGLWGREAGRPFTNVDVNVLEASLCFTETGAAMVEKAQDRPRRTGVNRFTSNHPTTVYATSDGWIGVSALTPAQWSSLVGLIGRPEFADDPRYRTSVDRVAHADEIDAIFGAIMPTRTTEHWLIEGQKLRVPLAPVPRHVELIETAHWRERGSFAPMASRPSVMAPSLPFRMAFDGVRSAPAAQADDTPLGGIRVVDFSMGWAGPLATRHLADLGADVIKIESHSHYDWWRGWEPPGASDPPAYELKAVFNIMNRGKRGISLDLTTPEGSARARQLVARADIVIENYAPGVMAKLGLGYEALQRERPGLIMVSMGAFGASGPWSFFRAYGSTVEHASGMPHLNGQADWPPCLQHGAYGDPVAGIYGAVAALSALHGRKRVGGAWIDLAQVECLFQLGADSIIAAQVDGDPPRMGNRSPYAAPRCVAPTRNPGESVAVVVKTNTAWTALCSVIGRPDWADDETLRTPEQRNSRGADIEAALAAWAARFSADEAAAALQADGVAAAPITPIQRLATLEHLVQGGSWLYLDRRHVGRHIMAAPPYLIDGDRPVVTRPAPLLGEHTAEVLQDLAPA